MVGALAVLVIAAGYAGLLWLLLRQRRAGLDAQARAKRLSGFLLTLSRANRAVLRIEDEAVLWREACQLCVQTGHAVLACVYLRDGHLARRGGTAGPAAQVLENVPDPLDLSLPDVQASYTARALREGRRFVSNDYVLDTRAGRWRSEAVAQGVRAIAWLPLRRAGEVSAVLMLCAGQPGFFDDELLALLDELGEDLSFALDNIDARRAQRAAQQEIAAGRDRFSALFFGAPLPMAIVSIQGRRILEVNEALCRLYGLDRAELLGSTTALHAYGLLPEDRERFYAVLAAEGRVSNLALRIKDVRGEVREAIVNAVRMPYLGEECVLITSLELSSRRAG
ncbi:GAF domain-containing protein [Roseateles saccharophilus]|uniref:PAS domain S-box-containing protein n=1 Tax=Roseateles saccharophilus TaxID=304 RepID=A0A4R3UFZ6_ROSSA|nr:GAF domain-containing protein [Roseateles saccharophilus]MDG0835493.1 PAS domain S-box protein [Roseateles saccharophilus]TCU86098.1 PAS domain S-box-containing protein [Roseateles saccharophilus]